MMTRLFIIFSILMSLSSASFAERYDVYPDDFKSDQEVDRYKNIIEAVRCTVCQNQTIASSKVDLARELRVIILEQIQSGMTDDDILNFLVERYGEFILYKPLFSWRNIFIWFGPFIILFIAIFVVSQLIRARNTSPSILTNDEQKLLKESLEKFTQTNNNDKD